MSDDDEGQGEVKFDLVYWAFAPRYRVNVVSIIGAVLIIVCLLFVVINLSDTVSGLVQFINPMIDEYNSVVNDCGFGTMINQSNHFLSVR